MDTKRRCPLALVALAIVASCGPGEKAPVPADRPVTPTTGVLLDVQGELAAGDVQNDKGSLADHYEVLVSAGQRLTILVTSPTVDTIVHAQPPGGAMVSNDDFGGDRTRSQVDLVAPLSGPLKITVTTVVPRTLGPYRLAITAGAEGATTTATVAGPTAPAWQTLQLGSSLPGALGPGDAVLPTGQSVDNYLLAGGQAQPVDLAVTAQGWAPQLVVLTPSGRLVQAAADASGAARAVLPPSEVGFFRIQVLANAPGVGGAYTIAANQAAGVPQVQLVADHHQTATPSATAVAMPVNGNSTTQGRLEGTDERLPSGELADRYSLVAAPGATYTIDLQSSDFDAFLVLRSPSGREWQNDDAGESLNAQLGVELEEAGTYEIVATSYRAGDTGGYVLKVRPGIEAGAEDHGPETPTPVAAPAAGATERRGELAQGDAQLRTGELYDTHTFTWTAGQRVSLRLVSTAFDTYLVVRAPSGQQADNDDPRQGETNAALDYTVTETGLHTVLATSYQAGMSGPYVLTVEASGGAGQPVAGTTTPAEGEVIRGALESSDRPDQTGRLRDVHSIRLRQREHVRIDLSSGQFDTVLVVEPPSGQRIENDDVTQGNTNSSVDFVATRAGAHRVIVTSYRSGELGPYELRVFRGAEAAPAGTQAAAAGQVVARTLGQGTTRGALAQGDSRLQSGEFSDDYPLEGTVGQTLRIRVTSAAFDPYVIVKAPSGRQQENDDLTPSTRDAGLDFTFSEPGRHTLVVTSYRPGETGDYTLSIDRAGAAATPSAPVVAGGTGPTGGRVYGIFVGISDYPMQGDLPECANDALKLSEELQRAGLLQPSDQVVLTDGQATTGALRQAFATMSSRVGPADTFLFFFSGHGGQRPSATDPNELDRKDETIVLVDGEIVDDEMARFYSGIRGRVNLIALDSCFSGGFAKDVISAERRMGLFSSEEDLTSSVAAQFQAGGYLSHFLRTGVAGEADQTPRDGRLSAGELSHYLHRMFGTHVTDVDATDQNLAQSFQHLVIDRGAVHVSEVLFAYR